MVTGNGGHDVSILLQITMLFMRMFADVNGHRSHPFQGGNTGSDPVGVTNSSKDLSSASLLVFSRILPHNHCTDAAEQRRRNVSFGVSNASGVYPNGRSGPI